MILKRAISQADIDNARLNNQFTLITGQTQFPQTFVTANEPIVVFVESFVGTGVTLTNRAGQVLVSGQTSFSSDHTPLRCDGGVVITAGTITALKGFVIR